MLAGWTSVDFTVTFTLPAALWDRTRHWQHHLQLPIEGNQGAVHQEVGASDGGGEVMGCEMGQDTALAASPTTTH